MKGKSKKNGHAITMCVGILLILYGLGSINSESGIRIICILGGALLCLLPYISTANNKKQSGNTSAVDDSDERYRKSVEQMRDAQRTHERASSDPLLKVASTDDLIITTQGDLADFNRNYKVIGERRTKVVGVTFRNDDGSNRQSILANCHTGDEIMLRYFEFRGAPAYAVHTQHGQIGNLSAELAAEMGDYGDDVYVVGRVLEVTGGYQGLSFGCNIVLTFYGPKLKSDQPKDAQPVELSKNVSSDTTTTFEYTASTLHGYNSPPAISPGKISILTEDEMHVFLRHYCKADEIRTKVKGVSYRNDDGTDRQCILAHCHAGDQLRFKRFEYAGTPAYAVYCDWGQIGNLSAEIAKDIAARAKPCILLGEILNVSGGYHGEYFGCNICVNIYEKY